jgi:enoyl-CoA hydratase/carnithine racemase
MGEHIALEAANRIQWIRFDRPEKKNALTFEMYEAMTGALERAAKDSGIRVVCFTGAGDAFTSGADVKTFIDRARWSDETPPHRFLTTLAAFEKPIVAAVNGFAVGIGATMLLHCDLVYASTRAVFRFPFVDLGLVPEAASSLLLPRLAGHVRACELFLLGERFDARTALAIGLVNALLPPRALLRHAETKARRLAAKPPAAVRATKALLKEARPSPLPQMRTEFDRFEERLRSPEAKEAVSAFLERREPDFSSFE